MPGTIGSGPTAKPLAEIKLLGNFRRDRHGHRIDDLVCIAGGKPKRPRGLCKAGKELWKWSVESLPAGIYTEADTGLLHQALCWWLSWDKAVAAGDTVEMERASRNYVALSKVLYFGPVGRTKLVAAEPHKVKGIQARDRDNGKKD